MPQLEVNAQRLTRHLIFFILSVYAVSKVLRTQFRVPYVQLDTPLGDVQGYMLAWRFFGYSHGHEVFVALGEWVGPALLLFWPTTTLGACITAVVMANVVVVNFTHDLPVQRFSSCLLALTLYLVFLDGRRLLNFFILNQPVPPRQRPAPLIQSPWGYAAAKGAWMTLALAYSVTYIAFGDSRPTPIAGAWAVQSSGAGLADPWWAVYFERGVKDYYPGSIRNEAGGRPERFHYEMDVADHQLHMIFSNSTSVGKNFHGSYELEGGDRLRLRGMLGEQTVDIRLVRKY